MKNITVHLSKDLISKYGIRKFPIRKGDMVRIVRGDAEKEEKLNIVGKEAKVIKVLRDNGKVIVENINLAKADGKMKPRKVDPSALVLTKIVIEDKFRRARLTSLASLRNKTVEAEPEPQPAEEEKKEETAEEGSSEEVEVESETQQEEEKE